WTRIEESCGEDGYLTATLGYAFVDGLQSKGFENGVAATTKHFLGYGGANTLSWKEMYEEVLLPHEVIVRKLGSESLMTSYNKFRDEYAVCSDTLLNVSLRGNLQYEGTGISDYGSVQQDSHERSPEFLKQCAIDALVTGNDIELCSPTSYQYIPELVREGRISEDVLEKAVKRALMMKARAGLLDPEPKLYAEGPLDLDSKDSRQLAYDIAKESMVLLKNDGILPLAKGKKVAIVGPNANSYWSMLGDYTFQSMQLFFHRHEVDAASLNVPTLLDELTKGYEGEITYSRGCDWSSLNDIKISLGGDARITQFVRKIESPDPTDWKAAIKTAAESDVIIAAMGENIYLSGENRTRNGIRLPGDQEQFVKELEATGKPVILVVFGGHPQVIDAVADGAAAIVQAWFPGEEGGHALTDILTGKVNPSGKLCVSYPKTEATELFCYNELPSQDLVAYPFGYGLSYTSFKYSDIKVQPSAKTSDKYLTVSCTVTNTGSCKGDEVAQLYALPLSGQPLKPVQLKGYKRLSLAAGESAEVSFQVAVDQLAWWSEEGGKSVWTVSPGDYAFAVGGSSADLDLRGNCTLSGNPAKKALRDEYFALASVK
ncbi:MAG: glycoside hydrolase family 3 C-terminal domain-containing protein, partial [Bacteroidales bacterium]|nr:glycoside hydrolase family 3 C-terminal domain-containing protein [Bacteroidales bacterium]